ncbi:MAG: hypothetical protein IJU13_05720 [Bacteroidales bacterium]|nr:hypothetical protein [Bacteroidales bacterium]
MKIKKLLFVALCLCPLFACNKNIFDDAEYARIIELVPIVPEELVSIDGGDVNVHVYASGTVKVTVMNDIEDWAYVDVKKLNGDGDIPITFERNIGFRRMVKLLLDLNNGEKLDTVYVKQEGVDPYLECAAPYAVVDGSASSSVNFDFSTNIPLENLSHSVNYEVGSTGWVQEIAPEMEKMNVSTSRNPSDHISRAVVRFYYVDGWEEYFKVDVIITSSDSKGEFGTPITFEEMLAYAGKGTINEAVYVDGVVISDWHSKNMNLNQSIAHDQVDVSWSDRTAYMQKRDGSKGVRLLFNRPEDNTLVKGTLVSVSLEGATVVKEDDPVRYTISGLTPLNMVKSEAGIPVVEKRKAISAITDDDIYTFVTIPNTEFHYKTGSYVNVYENYALKSSINEMCPGNNNRIDGWSALLVDNTGKGIYAPINMLCLWRRTGSGVPQGVGDTQGIIVHENNTRYGDQGRYQIRVIDETGFCQAWEGASTYKQHLKWDGSPYHYRYELYEVIDPRYADPQGQDRVDSVFPSDDFSADNPNPKGLLYSENKTVGSASGGWPFGSFHAFCAKFVTNSGVGDRGIAATDYDENPRSLTLGNEIKGWFKWEGNEIVGYNGLVIETSTKNLSGSMLTFSYSFDVGKISAGTSQYFPAHWCMEYSIDEGQTYTICRDCVTNKEYVHLRSLPWWDINIAGIRYYTCSSCGLGATEHMCVVPSNVFGKNKVLFRIRPYDNVMAIFPIIWNGDTETSEVHHNTYASTTINFENIVIRYK